MTAITDMRDQLTDARLAMSGYRESVVHLAGSAPTLTTALLVLVFAVGAVCGWQVAKPITRASVNSEWRAKLAAGSAAIKKIVAAGDAESDVVDREVIQAIGDIDAQLDAARARLEAITSRKIDPADRCTVPADCVRE